MISVFHSCVFDVQPILGEMIGNRKILSTGSTWKNLGLDMRSLDATKKFLEHHVSNSWSLNFHKSLMKWLFMICVHVSEHQNMLFLTENIYIYISWYSYSFLYIHRSAMAVCMRTYTNYHILTTQHGPTWTFLFFTPQTTRWSRIFSLEPRCFTAATSIPGTQYFLRS